ncbi:MAG: T9SS type A sorting domain-containing protein [Tannerellaceae bacterium]|nr:T9SS type A sorting domain-containing protein [Tannerellaceae bacterium]
MKTRNLFLITVIAILATTGIFAQDVYVAGITGNRQAAVWKNGVITNLTMPNAVYRVSVTSVFVYKGDVYVTGFYRPNSVASTRYIMWKNNVLTEFPTGEFPQNVFVSNNDVYLAGSVSINFGKEKAAFWKNGVPTIFPNAISSEYVVAIARAIHVVGNDVYVVGDVQREKTKKIIRLWKNGAPTDITDGVTDPDLWAVDLCVDGSDVYITGYETALSNSYLWKNGVSTLLSNAWDQTTSIYAHNNNVYVAGYHHDKSTPVTTYVAMLWTNGVIQSLPGAYYNDVTASGRDVYLAGWRDGYGATLWKNGVPTTLSTPESDAMAVFVGDGSSSAEGIREDGKGLFYDPAAGEVSIYGLQPGETIGLYDFKGSLLISDIASGETKAISVARLSSGAYFVKTGSGRTFRWVKRP